MAQVVGGRYQVIAHLGGGTLTDVSLAKTEAKSDVGKLSVIKRLKLGADSEPEALAQFAEDARLSVRLNHPSIAQAFETGDDAEGPFLVLEYLDGQTLARIRSRAKRRAAGVPRAIALHIATAMATGLAYAHSLQDQSGKPLKIFHRHLSPEKIIVTYSGTTKLIDFGAAPPAVTKSRGAAPIAGVAYMAPEQAKPGVIVDARADVFAAGLILWELLAGKRMWEGLSEADVAARLTDDKPLPTLRSVVPDIPPALDAICTQALAKVRDDRFDSGVELREAIEKATNAPGLRSTTREVAELVTSLFEEEREKMRAIVDEVLARPADGARALPHLGTARPTRPNQLADVDSDPSLWASVSPAAAPAGAAPAAAPVAAPARPPAPPAARPPIPAPAPAPAPAATPPPEPSSAPKTSARTVEVLRVEQAPSPDRRFALLVGGAVLIAFAGVAVVALTHESKPEEPLVSTPPRPTASTPTDPAASAYTEPEEVTIEITVTPPNARLFVDSIRTADNPHRTKVVRGKFVHELKAEADGFETRTMKVQFDRDRSIDIALTPKRGTEPVRPRPPTPPSPAPAPAPAAPPKDAGGP